MLTTQKDIENYVYNYVTESLKGYINQPITNNVLNYIDYIKDQINKEIIELLPLAVLPPKIDIEQDDWDKGLVNIKITLPAQQYNLNLKAHTVSDNNVKTHIFNKILSYAYNNAACNHCGYILNKDQQGYYSYDGDFSCDEYIIKNIIE